jgi:hypothetical protein
MFTLADAILSEDISNIQDWISRGVDVNQLDEYGFTPLIEAAIINNIDISRVLLSMGANPNLQDVTGATPLQWAAENNNLALCRLLLQHHANPNVYNLSGQSILVMPTLRHQKEMVQCLTESGADLTFAKDYINTKLLGHVFELIGTASILDPQHHYVEVDFEGFYLEVTLALIANSLSEFQNHFSARKLRNYFGLSHIIMTSLDRAGELIKYQQYRFNRKSVEGRIKSILMHDPAIIPVGYEGHAITFIKYGDYWVRCDRREDSRHYDNVQYFRIRNISKLNTEFLMNLVYVKQKDQYINGGIERDLGLEPITELKIEAQISGNCSWANVEAAIPALFFLILMQFNHDEKEYSHYKTVALNFFHRWREWNKERLFQFFIQNYQEADSIRKSCSAEILGALLFQKCDIDNAVDRNRIEKILSILMNSPYEYILENYLRVYYYEGMTQEGKRFAEFLKQHDYQIRS